MKKKYLYFVIPAVVILLAWFAWNSSTAGSSTVFVPVEQSDFEITVTTTGELDAKNSTRIMAPSGDLRQAQLWQVQITRIAPEGTILSKGDFVAELDKSQLTDKLREQENELTQIESQFEQSRLDTTLTLREARDNLINLKYAVEEKKIVLEQSAYEPPATIKQAEISLDKANRDYEQAKSNYEVKVQQAKAKMREVAANLSNVRSKVDFLKNLMSKFQISAPENGILIYAKEWNGKKKREGSNIGAWDPVVATLPDLKTLISRTYVNEVDIRKIKVGQSVKIGLDAFPDKKLTGLVTSVANMGEQKPNSDAKVFEVLIEVNETDSTLRPSMTTSNVILAERFEKVVSIPLEAIHSQGDSITYVYKRSGISTVKQEVKIGKTNDTSAIIEAGLLPQDEVALSIPLSKEDEIILLSEAKTSSSLSKK